MLGGKRNKVLQWKKGRRKRNTNCPVYHCHTAAQPTVTERKAEGGRKSQGRLC